MRLTEQQREVFYQEIMGASKVSNLISKEFSVQDVQVEDAIDALSYIRFRLDKLICDLITLQK